LLLGNPADTQSLSIFTLAVRRLETCDERYAANVGPPPWSPWQAPAKLVLRACHDYARGERELLSAVGNEGGDLILAGNNALASAVQTGQVAAVAFERTFVWNRHLPRIGGVSDDSRIEPLFSRIASPIVRRPVEIRCWSEADWSKVLAEFRAWLPG